ncbi:MAG: diguanylate cyclase, partial [Halopseudomonas sp.]
MRPDGSQAFLDNQRIHQVNKKAGFEQFYPRDEERWQEVLPATHSGLQKSLDSGEVVEYYDFTSDGERLYTLLFPVHQERACGECHLKQQTILGLIKLTTSLKQVDQDITDSRNLSWVVLCLSVLLIMLTLSIFVRRTVVSPIQTITQAMREAASGDLSQRVPVPRQLELRKIADSFNQKIAELETIYSGLHQERNKLSTIILGAQEGMVATDAEGRVVLVNPAAEKLLGRSYETVAKEGFESVFGDPNWLALLGQALSPDNPVVAELHQDGKSLHIQLASIANGSGRVIGTAVLMRDITQEDELRKRLEHQSRTDALTGLFNRRYFDQELDKEFRLSLRYRQPVSLVLFDVDHFKRFNDEYGHDQGDRVLQQVAKTVQENIRAVDVLCRYGGEEFVVIMPGADIVSCRQTAEQIRLAIESMRVDELQVTCSFGLAVAPHASIKSTEQLLKAADEAMYQAKQSGRNCVRALG